jgi:esterase/lipase superfamily enzyme
MAKKVKIYYATNRKHSGSNRWQPTKYGTDFSSDGRENLRLGKVTVTGDAKKMNKHLDKEVGYGVGDGGGLAGYFTKLMGSSRTRKIEAFPENINREKSESNQDSKAFGSVGLFNELQNVMRASSDVLVYIHGYNVDWKEAVGSALALQELLNQKRGDPDHCPATVILFSWPSDGSALPFAAYKSDREDAESSGKAIGRGFLKLRDFLVSLRGIDGKPNDGVQLCNQEMHLLCHSMGNYVLQNALARLQEFSTGTRLPRLFEHIFLCSPDVDDDVLEPGKEMGRLHEMARSVSIYFNRGDNALRGSDITKGNPDRLGAAGNARPSLVHNKVHQIDCGRVVGGFMEHSYYMDGRINDDIKQSIGGLAQEDDRRVHRVRDENRANTWVMRK